MIAFFRSRLGQSLVHFDAGDVASLASHHVHLKIQGDGRLNPSVRHWLEAYSPHADGLPLSGLNDPRIARLFACDFSADGLGPGWICHSLCKDAGQWYSAAYVWQTPTEHVAQALTLHFHAYSASRPYPAINLNTYVHHERGFLPGAADNHDLHTGGLLGTVQESITGRLAPRIVPTTISHTLQLPDCHVANGEFSPWQVVPQAAGDGASFKEMGAEARQPPATRSGMVPFQVPQRHLRLMAATPTRRAS